MDFVYTVAQNKPKYSTFQSSLRRFAWSQSRQFWRCSESGFIYYQTFTSFLVITSLFNRMMRPFIVHRIVEPENWPPNSPDLNPVDYSIWWALKQLVYRRRRNRDVEHLKEVVQTCWQQIGQDVVIDRTIGQFRKWLSLVATGGRHIEHHFD